MQSATNTPMLMRHLAAAALACLIFNAAPALAATFLVNSTADAVDAVLGNGICATSGGVCTLRAAVQEANQTVASDTISVPAGTYQLTFGGTGEDIAAQGDLDIRETVIINGAGVGSTIIDGTNNDRIFHVINGTASIVDLSAINGNPGAIGGAIYGESATIALNLTRVTISANVGSKGGGIYLKSAVTTSVFTDVTVANNTGASDGGGVHFENAPVTWTGGAVTGHFVSGKGAGLFLKVTTISLTDVAVSNNTNATTGGGLYNEQTTLTIDGCTFDGNEANAGGGIGIKNGNTTITNTTISANDSGGGAGLRVEADTTTLTNVTITDSVGFGVRLQGGTIEMRNSMVVENVGGDCTGALTSLGNNLDTDGTCGFATTAVPLLGPLQNNGGTTLTHALLSGSPAIDTGTNTGCPSVDQRDVARPVDGDGNATATCDIGAYEYEAPLPPLEIVKGAYQPDGTPIATGATLPSDVLFQFMLYVNNDGVARSDVSIKDVLDAAFVFQTGSLRVDNSIANCAAAVCTSGEEAAIFAAVAAAPTLTDAADADVASYSAGITTVDVGDKDLANAQLDVAANRVFALLFTVQIQ